YSLSVSRIYYLSADLRAHTLYPEMPKVERLNARGSNFRMLGMDLVRRHCAARCKLPYIGPHPRPYGAFFCVIPKYPVARNIVLACRSLTSQAAQKRAGLANLNRSISGVSA